MADPQTSHVHHKPLSWRAARVNCFARPLDETRGRYHPGMAYRDLPPSERRLIVWQLAGVGVLLVGVGLLVWAAVAYYQAASIG